MGRVLLFSGKGCFKKPTLRFSQVIHILMHNGTGNRKFVLIYIYFDRCVVCYPALESVYNPCLMIISNTLSAILSL